MCEKNFAFPLSFIFFSALIFHNGKVSKNMFRKTHPNEKMYFYWTKKLFMKNKRTIFYFETLIFYNSFV